MTLWIVTTGNTDVQLKHDNSWDDLYGQVEEIPEFQECRKFSEVAPDSNSKNKKFLVPSRVLGLVYGPHAKERYETDLEFPLLSITIPKLRAEIANDTQKLRVVVLLTDQTEIFLGHIYKSDCPFWKDTCTLKPILKWYFNKELGVTPEFLEIKLGKDNSGIDHWNDMLTLVTKKLSELKCDRAEKVYISHQAGTPAISSAVQFATISQFNKVSFLVSNQFSSDGYSIVAKAQVIPISTYWRALQIEKAKQLIEKGEPGAALEILTDIPGINSDTFNKLKSLVNRFNIRADSNSSVPAQSEFEPQTAAKRIVDALDLIEIFLENGNSLLGVTLLAAAQETFLKAAILHLVSQLPEKKPDKGLPKVSKNLRPSDLIAWENKGLILKSKRNLKKAGTDFNEWEKIDFDIAKFLKFPVPEEKDKDKKAKGSSKDFYYFWGRHDQQYISDDSNKPSFYLKNIREDKYFEPNKSRLLKWLKNLSKIEVWDLLTWYCDEHRDRELDIRNQLIHNLRGSIKEDLIKYLQGNPKEAELEKSDDVVAVYRKYVKQKFGKALQNVGLCESYSQENQLKEELQQLANEIQ